MAAGEAALLTEARRLECAMEVGLAKLSLGGRVPPAQIELADKFLSARKALLFLTKGLFYGIVS